MANGITLYTIEETLQMMDLVMWGMTADEAVEFYAPDVHFVPGR